jgi:protein O-GlcNAc transferase
VLTRFFRALTSDRPSRRLNDEGLALWARGDLPEAEEAFRAALRKKPGNASATSNLGTLLMVLHRYDAGMALLQEAARIAPDQSAGIWVNLANAWHLAGQGQQAIDCHRRALGIDPDHLEANVNILRALLEACDWDSVDRQTAFIRRQVAEQGAGGWRFVTPFNSFFLPFDRHEQRAIAGHYAATLGGAGAAAPRARASGTWDGKRRVRLGYLSSDFHDHATLHLTLGLYGRHDRRRFEVFAYSIGVPDAGPHRQRVMRDCDHFADVHGLGDAAIAARIAQDGIDILLDMKGYTGGSRPGVLALRPVPVQVNYLGYPGTMGADFMDWLVSDAVLVPPEHENGYTEKIVRLPFSYQATDDRQAVDPAPVDRTAAGLPEEAFVYCCFNTSAKIDRASFAAWVDVLLAVPHAVLWLLDAPAAARDRLAAEARRRGVDPARLVYAPVCPKPRHLARLALADVVLDTFICNAHTTATDALWMGVPVVTRTGETFASRVASSLLHAAGLPELAVPDADAYVALAIRLAREPARLAAARAVLARRADSPLFDSSGYVRALEDALLAMLDRPQAAPA